MSPIQQLFDLMPDEVKQALLQRMGANVVMPTLEQAKDLAVISAVSGVVIVNNPNAALRVFGPNAAKVGGAFASAAENRQLPCDMIIMNTDPNSPMYYRVLAHELAHSTGQRLGRESSSVNPQKLDGISPSYAIEELVAETSARKTIVALGLDTPEILEVSQKYTDGILASFKRDMPDMDISLILRRVEVDSDKASALVTQWMQPLTKYAAKAA